MGGAARAPDWVLPPVAVELDHGWVLLPDGGPTLGDRLDTIDLAEELVAILPRYGQLQRDLAPQAGELLSSGIADMRPAAMPGRFDEAVEAASRFVAGHGQTATAAPSTG
jgi:hypothetical protein